MSGGSKGGGCKEGESYYTSLGNGSTQSMLGPGVYVCDVQMGVPYSNELWGLKGIGALV